MARRSSTYWQDYPSTVSLITAADLNDIEATLDSLVGTTQTARPICEARISTNIASVTAGTNYVIGSNMTATVDPLSMFSLNGDAYRITLPIAGRYEANWIWYGDGISGYGEAHVTKNRPNSTSGATSVTTYGVFSAQTTSQGNVQVRAVGSEVFAANDYLGLMAYPSVTQSILTVGLYTPAKSKVVVRYLGPT